MYNAGFNESHAVWLHLWVSNHNICDGKLAMAADGKALSEEQQMLYKCHSHNHTLFWGYI